MPELSANTLTSIQNACQENLSALSHSLGSCFQQEYRLEMGGRREWSAAVLGPEFDGPGLIIVFHVAGKGILGLVPESLPLPEWYAGPDETQSSRLQTLATEWSLATLPLELESERFGTKTSRNLKASVIEAGVSESTQLLELKAFSADVKTSTASLYFICPVETPPSPDLSTVVPGEQPNAETQFPQEEPQHRSAELPATRRGSERLMNLPVNVIVRLAAKKIEVGQLLGMAPGSLITFNKSCEDLLDLYVNNQPYCRGEAVKIGENFGLKVNEVGCRPVREEHVLNL